MSEQLPRQRRAGGDVVLSVAALETLLCKARAVGWEQGRGLQDGERVDIYLHGLVRELVDDDVAHALGWLG